MESVALVPQSEPQPEPVVPAVESVASSSEVLSLGPESKKEIDVSFL